MDACIVQWPCPDSCGPLGPPICAAKSLVWRKAYAMRAILVQLSPMHSRVSAYLCRMFLMCEYTCMPSDTRVENGLVLKVILFE